MPIPPDVDRLLEASERELVLRRYSPRTRKVYLGHIRRFLESTGLHPRDATEEDVRTFLLRAMGERVSVGYQRQAIAALPFLFARSPTPAD